MAKHIILIFFILLSFQFAQQAEACKQIAEAFHKFQLVPDILLQAPKRLLRVSYNAVGVYLGDELTPTQVKNQPLVEWFTKWNSYYTLIMTDPDAPSRAQPTEREFLHWMVVNIPGNRVYNGEVVVEYVGSGPPKGSGLHRYTFLLYKQPGKIQFDEPHVANNSLLNRSKFSTVEFAKKYNLDAPTHGNFFQAQYDDYVPTVHAQLGLNTN